MKALVRRAHANEALCKKRDALLGNHSNRISCSNCVTDITRLIILDADQIKPFAESTQKLLKEVSKELADANFPVRN